VQYNKYRNPVIHFILLFIFCALSLSPSLFFYLFELVMELENCCQPDCWLEEFMYPEIPATSHVGYGCLQSNSELLLTFCACFATFKYLALKFQRLFPETVQLTANDF